MALAVFFLDLTPKVRETKAKITYRSVKEIITGYLKRVKVAGMFAIEPRMETREEFVIAGY